MNRHGWIACSIVSVTLALAGEFTGSAVCFVASWAIYLRGKGEL